MANKDKVDIKRSDQFQEMEDALSQAMADLDSTIDRVSALFREDEGDPEDSEAASPRREKATSATDDTAAKKERPAPREDTDKPASSE